MNSFLSPGAIIGLIVTVVLIVGGGMWGCPAYNVYSERMVGEAELAKAEYTRRTAVVEAEAKLDAAAKLADAEVARARGVAQANQIIGDSLKGEEGANYLRYLWIDKFDSTRGQVVYVPTESALPVFLESGRMVTNPETPGKAPKP
jgi:regulator of protease activity HflC (stomatin/prohibitin superfamily)